jgi:hypothetical protein
MMTQKTKPGKPTALIPQERIENKIYLIQGKKVMLDRDLAELYGVKTEHLKRQVRRNLDRFPEDFLLILTKEETANLTCQNGRSSWGGARVLPFAFTEHGILMLSSVLKSSRAVQVNIQIMRAFVKLREFMISHKELARKIDDLERKYKEHDHRITLIFQAIKELLEKPVESEKKENTDRLSWAGRGIVLIFDLRYDSFVIQNCLICKA